MKRKIFFSAFAALFLVSGFIFLKTGEQNNSTRANFTFTNNNLDNRFLIGAIESKYDDSYNYSHFNTLGFNMWHSYIGTTEDPDTVTGRYYPFGRMAANDGLLTPVSQYVNEVKSTMEDISTKTGNTRLLLHRPKIDWLCGACPALDAGAREAITSYPISDL